MSEQDFEVVVLGMSPGGEQVAGRLAEAGLAVAGVESNLVGGECPYYGCIPSKMMIRAANALAEAGRVKLLAGSATTSPDWGPVARRVREATHDWDDAPAAGRFTAKGGHLFRGVGKIVSPGVVRVGDDTLTASRGIVIATGTEPTVPPIPGLAGTPFWTNREAVKATAVPRSLIVLGGGSIGVEFAQVFARFGAKVTVVEALGRLLPFDEPEASALLADVFGSEGIGVRAGAAATGVSHDGAAFRVVLAGGEALSAPSLLVATGRHADLATIGAGAAGIDETGRFIGVDERMRAAPGVWALGDIVGHGAFTHMSVYHAEIVIADILGEPHHAAEYHAVPRVAFTDPEIGSVGLTEAQARERGLDTAVGMTRIAESSRGWIHDGGNAGFIKLIADADAGILVGATSAGPAGGEVLSMLTLAVHARLPVQRLREMIYAFPTFHRAVQAALAGLP